MPPKAAERVAWARKRQNNIRRSEHMNYHSLLELLAQEDAVCRQLQTKVNILSALRQVEEEGREETAAQKERRKSLRERLIRDVTDLSRSVAPLRLAIGARIMELQAAAESVIRGEIERQDHDGEG